MSNIFHYAFKVKDLATTRQFYIDLLGCVEGRSTDNWIDFDFYGNQLTAHVGVVDKELDYCGLVDGVAVPIPHFGCVLTPEQFLALAAKLETAKIKFILKPQVRFAGQSGQQQTMFVLDFSGNPLEFKSFADESELFNA